MTTEYIPLNQMEEAERIKNALRFDARVDAAVDEVLRDLNLRDVEIEERKQKYVQELVKAIEKAA